MSMTSEQREVIETMQHWIEYEKEHKDKINKADELIHIQEIVLNLVKDLQRKNFELEQKNEYFAWLNKDLKDEIKRLKKEVK